MVSPYLPWSKHGKHVLKTGDVHPPLGIQQKPVVRIPNIWWMTTYDHHSSHVAWQARSTARLEIPLAGCRRCWFRPCLPVHAARTRRRHRAVRYSQAARQAAGHVSSFPWLTLTSLAQRVESGYLWIARAIPASILMYHTAGLYRIDPVCIDPLCQLQGLYPNFCWSYSWNYPSCAQCLDA